MGGGLGHCRQPAVVLRSGTAKLSDPGPLLLLSFSHFLGCPSGVRQAAMGLPRGTLPRALPSLGVSDLGGPGTGPLLELV